MKKILFILLASFVLCSCGSSKKACRCNNNPYSYIQIDAIEEGYA